MTDLETVQRESMEVDVLIVGAGSAGLACAIELQKQIHAHSLLPGPPF